VRGASCTVGLNIEKAVEIKKLAHEAIPRELNSAVALY